MDIVQIFKKVGGATIKKIGMIIALPFVLIYYLWLNFKEEQKMEDTNKEMMVTIPLRVYDELRDKANDREHLMERVIAMGNELRDLSNRVYNLEPKTINQRG